MVAPSTGAPLSSVIVPAIVAPLAVGVFVTARVAVAGTVLAPPLVEVEVTVLTLMPPVVPVTFTPIVHEPLTANVTPLSETVPDAATATGVPPHVLVNPFGVATTIPAGNVSVNPTPVRAKAFPAGLVRVKVRVVDAVSAMTAFPKALVIVGGASTLIVAEAVPPVPPSFELTVLVVLVLVPTDVPVVLTEKLHPVLGARLPPVKLIKFVPATATIVPPQEP